MANIQFNPLTGNYEAQVDLDTIEFSEFTDVGTAKVGTIFVGLSGGINARFNIDEGFLDANGCPLISYEMGSDTATSYFKTINNDASGAVIIKGASEEETDVDVIYTNQGDADLTVETDGSGDLHLNASSGLLYVNNTTGIDSILNENNLTSNSPTAIPTQSSVKSYVDSHHTGGTVTSVAMSVPSFLSVTGSPITTSGTLAVTYSGAPLPIANGGTNSSTALANGKMMVSSSGKVIEVNADSSMGGFRITNVANPLSDQDTATKYYVDNSVSAGPVILQGNWDASTNTPTLTAGVGTVNYAYYVSVAGSQTAPSGVLTAYTVGDLVYYTAGNIWDKVDQGVHVVSINGLSGVITGFGVDDLSDTTISGLSDAQVLIYNNGTSKWVNKSLSGGVTINNSGTATLGGSPTFTGVNISGLTASELTATDGSKNLQSLDTATYPSLTEISYVKGVTSAIQTQLNSKQATGNYITALTGDVTASGPGSSAATLATVNSNVGTFGSSTQSGQFSVNGKGLITSASNVTVTPAISSVTGLGTGVSTALSTNTGSAGAFVVNGGALGTPSSGTLSSCTGLPISTGVSGLGTGVATFLATPSSANLAAAVTDETGSGALVFANTPTLVTPNIGAATGTSLNLSGLTASQLVATDGSKNLVSIANIVQNAFNSINVVIFTATGTYTPSSGTKYCWIRAVGGGAGGGGTNGVTSQSGAGGGGGSGGYAESLLPVATVIGAGSTAAITVGTGGTGGSAGSNAGNVGNSTTVVANGGAGSTLISCGGGQGGAPGVASATAVVGGPGGTGGTATSGNLQNIPGGPGDAGMQFGAAISCWGGQGGSSPMGQGGRGGSTNSFGPSAGNGKGAGGGGATTGTSSGVAGGNGTDGAVIIVEYIST